MPKFLTLTFSSIVKPDIAKVVFRTFIKRLRRKYPVMSALWRAEMQRRGSPHFHLIIFRMPFVLQAELQDIWEKCTLERWHKGMRYQIRSFVTIERFVWRRRYARNVRRSRVFIKALKNARQTMFYASKYVAKNVEKGDIASLDEGSYLTEKPLAWSGRHWGIVNKKELPYAKREITIISDNQIAQCFRDYRATIFEGGAHNPLSIRLYSEHAENIYQHYFRLSTASFMDTGFTKEDFRDLERCSVRKRLQKAFGIRARNCQALFLYSKKRRSLTRMRVYT